MHPVSAPAQQVVVVFVSGLQKADEAEGSARRSGKGSKGSKAVAGRFVGIEVRVQRVYAGYLQDSAPGWPFPSLIVMFEEIYRRLCKFHHIPVSRRKAAQPHY
jgi:hypothetical protein